MLMLLDFPSAEIKNVTDSYLLMWISGWRLVGICFHQMWWSHNTLSCTWDKIEIQIDWLSSTPPSAQCSLSLFLKAMTIFSRGNKHPSVFSEANSSLGQKHNQTLLRAPEAAVWARWEFQQTFLGRLRGKRKHSSFCDRTKWKLNVFILVSPL